MSAHHCFKHLPLFWNWVCGCFAFFYYSFFHSCPPCYYYRSTVSIKVPMQTYNTYGCVECGAYYGSFRKLLEHLHNDKHMGQPASTANRLLKKQCLTEDRDVAIECLRILAAVYFGGTWPKTQAHLSSVIKANLPSLMANAIVGSWLDQLHRKTRGITIVAAGNRLISHWRQLNILWGNPQTLSWVS